jgi:hypothetical protein
MPQYYLIDAKNIEKYLSLLHQENSQRTLCGLDLLKENIQNNLVDILHEGKLMVEINSSTKEVTILGDEMNVKNWKIIFDKEKNKESIYNTFMFAIDYARQVE